MDEQHTNYKRKNRRKIEGIKIPLMELIVTGKMK